jgi:hypothetical protein
MSDMGVAPTYVDGAGRQQRATGVFGELTVDFDPAEVLTVRPAGYAFQGYQQLSNTTLASSSPLTVPVNATGAIVQNNGTQPARYRVDGTTTAPTASSGMVIPPGEAIVLDYGRAALVASRYIRSADGLTLDIEYFSN